MIEPPVDDSKPMEIDRRIGDVFSSLSPQLRRAARYLADHPEDVAVHSMRTIARAAAVQPSTMTRLARALDFHGYEGLRDEFRHRITGNGGFAGRASVLQSAGPGDRTESGYLRRHAEATVKNIERSLAGISEQDLRDTAGLLLACDRVAVTGFLSSFSLAGYVQYVANMALPGWSLIGATGNSLADRLTEMSAGDGLLVISYAPYARLSIEAACEARARGCRVVAISDSSLSPLASVADRLLVCSTEAEHYFPSGVAVVTILEALIGAIIAGAGDNAVHRLSAVENLRRELGEYWENQSQPNVGNG